MRITIFQIKFVHTVIFWFLSLCVLYALYSGIADRIADRKDPVCEPGRQVDVCHGAPESSVALREDRQRARPATECQDDALEKEKANRHPCPDCGTLYGVALVLIGVRLLR